MLYSCNPSSPPRTDPLPLKNDPRVLRSEEVQHSATFYPIQSLKKVVSVSGAGDCFTAAFVAAALRGLNQGGGCKMDSWRRNLMLFVLFLPWSCSFYVCIN